MRINYGVDWNENFFKVMMGDILLEELEKIEDFIDFRNSIKIQKINKRKQRTVLKKLKRVALHQVLEKLAYYLEGKKDKSEMTKKEMLVPSFPSLPATKTDDEDPQDSMVKDEDDGYCSE